MIQELLAHFEAEVASLPHPDDISSTPREREAAIRHRQTVITRRGTVRVIRDRLAELNPEIETLTRWRDFLVWARQQLTDQLIPLHHADKRAQGLRLSLQRIDRGLDFEGEMLPANLPLDDLLRKSGYITRDSTDPVGAWFGSLPTVERRLAELTAKRDDDLAVLTSIANSVGIQTEAVAG